MDGRQNECGKEALTDERSMRNSALFLVYIDWTSPFFKKVFLKKISIVCTKYYSLGGNCKNHIAGGENGCGKKALEWAQCRKSILKRKLRKRRHTGARDVSTLPLNKLLNKKVFSGSTLLKSTDCSPQYYNQNSEKVRYHLDSFTIFIQ